MTLKQPDLLAKCHSRLSPPVKVGPVQDFILGKSQPSLRDCLHVFSRPPWPHEKDEISRLRGAGDLCTQIRLRNLLNYTFRQDLADFIVVRYETPLLVSATHVFVRVVGQNDGVPTDPEGRHAICIRDNGNITIP